MASPNIRRSPSRRGPGDPWFTVGTVDVTTAVLIPLLTVFVWVAVAVNTVVLPVLWLSRAAYRTGFLWQLLTWPLASSASLGGAIGLFFFWSFGRILEEPLGPGRLLRLIGTNTLIIGVVALLLDLVTRTDALLAQNRVDKSISDYVPILAGPQLISLGVAVCVAAEFPYLRSFFNIPIRLLVGAFVFIEVLQALGVRYWLYLVQLAVTIVVSIMTLRAFGLGTELPSWIPRLPLPARLTGLSARPSARNGSRSGGRGTGFPRRPGGPAGSPKGAGNVVSGPWGETGTGTANASATSAARTPAMTRADREEVDQLLDKIARDGMESLSGDERARLEDASRRLREGERR